MQTANRKQKMNILENDKRKKHNRINEKMV